MRRKHCTDAELLALVHESPTWGSPAWVTRVRGDFHLNFCGRCRRRLAAMEAAANSWKEACLRPFEVTEPEVEAARQRFLERVAEEPARARWGTGVRVALVSGALACGVMAGIGVWTSRENAPEMVVETKPMPVMAGKSPVVTRVPMRLPELVQVAVPSISPQAAAAIEIADAGEAEVNLLWALHEARLCRGGSVEVVTPTSGVLAVRGVVETEEQLAALRILVSEEVRVPVAMEVNTASEAARTVTGEVAPAQNVATGRTPVGERLIRRWQKSKGLADSEAIRISNEAVRFANEAWVESWAIQRLVARFSEERRRGLKLGSRARLYEMLKSHFDELEKALRREQELLLPMVGLGPEGQREVGDLFTDVAKLSALVQDTFAGGGPEEGDPESRIRELLGSTLLTASDWGSRNLREWNVMAGR